ncbi:MAG: hypothetical protein PUA56_04745 [Bacillales bacterium]|nr:hypothetical protein [Bacillales bacterium]
MQFEEILISIGIVLVCVALFVGTYLLNKKTKKPEGCENLEENCSGCSLVGCSHHPSNNLEEKEKKEN